MKTHSETSEIRAELLRVAAATVEFSAWEQTCGEDESYRRKGKWANGDAEAVILLGGNGLFTPYLRVWANFDWRIASKAMGRSIFSKLLPQQRTPQDAMNCIEAEIAKFKNSQRQ